QCREETLPVLVEQTEHPLRDFGWQRTIRLVRLHAPVHLGVVEIDALMDKGLAHDVVGRIVEVLGDEGGGVNRGEARISTLDDMALNQLHRLPPSPFASSSRTRTAVLRLALRWP